MKFHIAIRDKNTSARVGEIETAHGKFDTPAFMPVATAGTIKGVAPAALKEAGVQILLANTYHLHLRPGEDVVAAAGGLHKFMAWDGPILTDSGGFQVLSLSDLRKVTDEGVTFKSHIDGSTLFLGPVEAVRIQEALGSDIAMAFDECPPADAPKEKVAEAAERTARWAKICLETRTLANQAMFGIVQGGMHEDLRRESAASITAMQFDGFAIGGVSVGEPKEDLHRITRFATPLLPDAKPRYLMGVGQPEDIVEGVAAGIDMFDCVVPTRNARNAGIFTSEGRIKIRNEKYRTDFTPLDNACGCYVCANFTRSYIRHLFAAGEMLGPVLATIHNISFYMEMMERIRESIKSGAFAAYKSEIQGIFTASPPDEQSDADE
jgi:queuine tRNA-ribosyltransferase